MRRRAAAILLSGALAAPASAHAAHDRGVAISPARASHAAFEPGYRLQFWRLRAVEPRSGAIVAATVWAAPDPRVVVQAIEPSRGVRRIAEFGATAAYRQPGGVRLVAGSTTVATLARRGAGWRLTARASDAELDLSLARPARGVAAGPWRLGEGRDGLRPRVRWSTPAADAAAVARLTTDSGETAFSRGRGYLDRTWGGVDLDEWAWHRWDLGQVFYRRGGAAVLHGLGSSDELSGPGSIDATFRGVLVRVTPRGPVACRPRVVRSRWAVMLRAGYAYANRAGAACGGTRVVLDATGEYFVGAEGGDYWERRATPAVDRRARGSLGTFDHLFWRP